MSSRAEIHLGASFNPVSSTPNYTHTPVFLLSGEKEVNAGRGVILFIHSKGSDAINTGGENDEQWLRQSKGCFCIRRHEKGKSHCDPVSEQQPFWLLSSWNVFSTLCVCHCSERELIDFVFLKYLSTWASFLLLISNQCNSWHFIAKKYLKTSYNMRILLIGSWQCWYDVLMCW